MGSSSSSICGWTNRKATHVECGILLSTTELALSKTAAVAPAALEEALRASQIGQLNVSRLGPGGGARARACVRKTEAQETASALKPKERETFEARETHFGRCAFAGDDALAGFEGSLRRPEVKRRRQGGAGVRPAPAS